MVQLISAGELADMRAESLRAMPDVATIMRPTITNGPGGPRETAAPTVGTTPCRLTASVLSGGDEQLAAGQLAGIMAYTLTVPPGTDIRDSDRIVCQGSTFEVRAGKRSASWNISDSYTLVEIQRS